MPTLTMTEPTTEMNGFSAAVLDALASQICVVDRHGVIVAVNRAWSEVFARNSARPSRPGLGGRAGVGDRYFHVCGEVGGPRPEDADDFAIGLRAVLNGEMDIFEVEYPSHSPAGESWFLGRITPLPGDHEGAVISHMDVTSRKSAEFNLEKLASTDELTGLANRRFFDAASDREFLRIRRYGGTGSLVMIDLDHFKQVNDTYGHPAGDEALRTFARICDAFLRDTDVIARFGGEEFAAILRDADADQALRVSEQLREAVERATVVCGTRSFRITASFGVSEIRPDDKGLDVVIDRADRALLEAKRAGRNRVLVS
jgi:diguanylate cyclase (GGDEF)-like protein